MADLIWATTKDSTSVHFGFCHKFHKHNKLFDLQHIGTCNALSGCLDIARYAEMIKKGDNILLVGFGAGMTAASAIIKWGGQ
jgi:3-oxoacyl-[acyl-carrier-protein] synthase III